MFAVGGGLSSHATSAHAIAATTADDDGAVAPSQFVIPGPQRSFLRMAGISQQVKPEEVLPLLSRNVFIEGYIGTSHATEFLVLLRRYVVQARELAELAQTTGGVLRVSGCDDGKPLLRILGYRVEPNCGDPNASLQTDDAERAFLAIDSGFPLPELEKTLQGGKQFEYPYSSTPVPVIFSESDWTAASKRNMKENSRDLLETMLYDPLVARLYWALSRMDPETSRSLQQEVGLAKLLPYAGVLDFYGRELCITGGKVKVPGGPATAGLWKDLVGASPATPAAFVPKLLAKDKGWLAAYFDVLSRVSGEQQAYFTDAHRLRFFYNGVRAPDPSASATRGTFRPAPEMLLMVTRLQLSKSGEPMIPGGIAVWRDILLHGRAAGLVHRWARFSGGLNQPDDLIQAMFALSRAPTESGPLQVYMAISEIDGRRPADRRLSPAVVGQMARKFEECSDQYRLFSEFPELTDDSITLFLNVSQVLNDVPMSARGNAYGTFQASVGIWQILARQGQISSSHLDDSFQHVVKPFANVKSGGQSYDAGRTALAEIFRYSTGKPHGSQDEIIELLAGPEQTTAAGKEVHQEVANRIRSVLDDQRLVSLDTVVSVGDGLSEMARGNKPDDYVAMLASQTREFEMPRPIFTNGERTEWAAGVYNNHHTDSEMQTDLPKILRSHSASHAQIEEARNKLASFLRDTLVGLNYAYYEPPGAQALHNNPLFVRSHDFAGETVGGFKTLWQAPRLLGQGSPAGGGAHFVGSLADLPYALADLEQDFISPDNVQALIWKEVTPELLTNAILPRWWNISPVELHAVSLYQRTGEELLTAATKDESLRNEIMPILSDRLPSQRFKQIEHALKAGDESGVLSLVTPGDTMHLAMEFRRKYPDHSWLVGTAGQELQELSSQHPEQVSWQRLSHDFGTPHPTIAQSYGLELLNVGAMPPFAGNPSRFLAESWDSPNLYWARLADESGYPPVMLNRLIPQLTRLMVEKIFATDFEDWTALVRAMRETGSQFREGKLTALPKLSAAGQ